MAALAGGDNAGARSVVRIDLADDEELVADAVGGTRDDLFGASAAIHLGGVDQGHAEIDAEPQCRCLFGGMAPVVAHVPSPLPQRRYLLAVAQGYISQLTAHLRSPMVSPRRKNSRRAAPYTRSSKKGKPGWQRQFLARREFDDGEQFRRQPTGSGSGGKCSQCGWNKHIRGMEFHHQDTSKEFCISESYKKTWEIITEEVDKCVLLCANCHRIEHARAQDDWINDVDRLKLF